jgi:diphthine-ammonia ligase
MKLGVLFSGGKDSLFACWRAMAKEEVACLITVVSHNPESYMFHTPNIGITALQAEAAGLPLVQVASAGEEERELVDLEQAICIARDLHGIEGIASGAILSVYQATRVQRICHGLGLWCFNPLWHTDQATYLSELLGAGFEVIISGVFSYPFDADWLGRTLDGEAVRELAVIAERCGITLTGEGGEYETCVLDAPFFTRRIRIREVATSYRNWRGLYHILDAELVAK